MHSPTFRTLIATRYHRNTSALKLDPKQFNAITQALDAIIRQDMRNDHSGNYQDLAMATIDALKQRNQTNSPELRSLLSIFEQRDNSCESLKQKAWEIFVLMEKKINQQLKIDWFSQDDVFITRRLEKNYPCFLKLGKNFSKLQVLINPQ